MNLLKSMACVLIMAGTCVAVPPGPDAQDQAALREAVAWAMATPRIQREYDYEMTIRIRLLFFWVAKDDVGDGYIKIGKVADDPRFKIIQLLFGSDPAKAPRAINRWGAGTEAARIDGSKAPDASAFVGFMKSSKGQSVSAMQRELSHESKAGTHLFEAIISRVDRTQAVSTTLPFYSDKDYDLHQLAEAQRLALDQLDAAPARKFRRLEGLGGSDCGKSGGFLSSTEELLDRSLKGEKTPLSLCYVYNARRYTLTLQRVTPWARKEVHLALKEKGGRIDQSYRDLNESEFQIRNQESGEKTDFSVLLGTTGSLRAVPIQINYQPNWWFQIVLNLKSQTTSGTGRQM